MGRTGKKKADEIAEAVDIARRRAREERNQHAKSDAAVDDRMAEVVEKSKKKSKKGK
jgi:hypothetical protein